jgi:hypothetical protein
MYQRIYMYLKLLRTLIGNRIKCNSILVDKDYKIGMRYFFAKHAALRRKSTEWLAQNQDIIISVKINLFSP